MKANEAPEKIYLSAIDIEEVGHLLTESNDRDDIEYTRTDAFIEKASEYIKEHLFDYWSQSVTNKSKFIEDFVNYMEGE